VLICDRPSRTALLIALGLATTVFAVLPAEALPIRKSHATTVLDSIDGFIVPRIDTLSRTTAHLAETVQAVCRDGGANDRARAAAVSSFADTVRAWGGVDFIRFGPVSREHRLERVLFWPDPRATTSRQLNGLVAARKPELLEPGAIARQSVAVQGLTALEILLFDEKAPLGSGTEEQARYRCALAGTIAANIDAVARELKSGWTDADGFRHKMLAAGSDNELYKDSSETVRDVVKAIATGLDLCRNRFVVPELTALAETPPKKVRLPFERADLTGEFLFSSLAALHDLFDATGLAAYVPADKPWMASFLPNAWTSLLADAKRLDKLRATERGSDAHLQALRKMRFDLGGIRLIIVKELAPNADIVLGFNELDGD
jgi:predicted lipoprotein